MGRRRDSTATGRGTSRSLCCWTWDGENLLPLDRGGEKPLLLGRRQGTTACGRDGEKLLLMDAGRREITAADFQTERNYCCLLDERWRGDTNTAAGRVTAVDIGDEPVESCLQT